MATHYERINPRLVRARDSAAEARRRNEFHVGKPCSGHLPSDVELICETQGSHDRYQELARTIGKPVF